jgi:phosphatidylglycerol:prolipoprotein diacylglycerol transferase
VNLIIVAESYLHRLNPVAIPLSDNWGIRWYGLAYLAGFLVAYLLIRWLARTGRSPLSQNSAGDLLVYAVVGVMVGGRLGYAIFYRPELFVMFSQNPPWWELLAIHRGGMASHGGIVGVLIAMVIFAKRHRVPTLHLIDLMAISAPPGLCFGRLANFVNGELWGKRLSDAAQADPPWWSVKYPDEVYLGTVDFSSVATELGGQETLAATVADALRARQEAVMEAIVPQLTAYWPSQLVQAICEGPVLFLLLLLVWHKPQPPGVLAGWFLVVYGVLRIFTEVVRQPDEGVSLIMGLQRGQILSVFMILLGVVIVVMCRKGPLLNITSSPPRATPTLP